MKSRIGPVLLFSLPSLLSAADPGAAFLGGDHSIRSVALGGVSAAAQGAQALGSNPALLFPPTGKSELYASFTQLWEETSDGHLAFASALSPKRAWGLSATFRDEGKTRHRDEGGLPTGTQTATHHETAAGAFSWKVWRGARVGVAGNIYQSTLAGESSDVSWAVDTGLSFQARKILYSLSVNHLGPGIKYIEQRDPLPSLLQLDASWDPGPLSVLAGYHRSLSGSGARGAMGIEYRVRTLALRAGLHADNQSSTNQLVDHLTTGFGLQLGKSIRMDYAYKQSAPDWGPAHSFALTWSWGETPRPPAPPKVKSKPPSPQPTDQRTPSPTRLKIKK